MLSSCRQKVQRAQEIQSEKGNISLVKKSAGFIYKATLRKVFPKSGYYTKAGIKVRYRKPLDSIVPGIAYSDEPNHEYALVSELRKRVEPGLKISVVGAGSGTTSVVAANQTTEAGSVTAFEGSMRRVKQAQNTINLNGVDQRCEVRHAIVGPAVRLHSLNEGGARPKEISPTQLPDCDVLELDCEGAEKIILEEMEIQPKVIIVETHPELDSEPEHISKILADQGYSIVNKIERHHVPVLTAINKTKQSAHS